MASPDIYQDYLENYHPHAEEFHQAVKEVCEDITEEYESSEAYAEWNIIERLIEPDRIIKFRVSWEDDKGKVHANRAWRVQFHNLLGAYKGGLRFHPTVNESVLKFLGFEQCFKNALTGLPMGGAKGGSDFNPKGKNQREIMRFCQSFMRELYRHIGPDTDVPAGDINVSSNEIGFMFGEYLRINNRWEGVLTGKTPGFGGSCGREEATGYGVIYFLREMLKARGEKIAGKSCTISGSGNVAQFCAEKAISYGGKVLTMSDSGGFVHDPDGIDEEKLAWVMELKNTRRGRISEYTKKFKSASYHAGKRPWSVKCDIALPCATQNEIEKAGAKALVKGGTFAVCEGANMPTTPEAVEIFQAAKIAFGPAKAANAGGVAVSALEMAQNAYFSEWSREEVDSRLDTIMTGIHAQCDAAAEKYGHAGDLLLGANVSGFLKVANAMLDQGVV